MYGYITALNVKPVDPGLEIFEIALFLQHESHVKCHPLISGVPKILIVSDLKICSSTAPFPFPILPVFGDPHENCILVPLIVLHEGDKSVTEI